MRTMAGPLGACCITACVLMPLWTSVLVRSYAWIVLLQRNGIVNNALLDLGVDHQPLRMLYTEGAVIIAMTHVLLPFMILPIYSALRSIPPDLDAAALNLGAGTGAAFFAVTLPLSLPGVFAGSLMIFMLALGFYVTPALVGGPRTLMIATLIGQQATELLNWPFAGALSGRPARRDARPRRACSAASLVLQQGLQPWLTSRSPDRPASARRGAHDRALGRLSWRPVLLAPAGRADPVLPDPADADRHPDVARRGLHLDFRRAGSRCAGTAPISRDPDWMAATWFSLKIAARDHGRRDGHRHDGGDRAGARRTARQGAHSGA